MSGEGRYRQRLSRFAENWRAIALRGLHAVVFGLVVPLWPGLVLAVLTLLFGIYALLDGGIVLLPALRSSDKGARRYMFRCDSREELAWHAHRCWTGGMQSFGNSSSSRRLGK